jgi:hypothetical protein
MLTVLIWLGSGFAFSVGVAVGAWAMSRRAATVANDNTKAEKLLAERNEIGLRQCKAMESIGTTLEELLLRLTP